jgi:hypothetical protein
MFVVEVNPSSGIHMFVIKCLRNFKYLVADATLFRSSNVVRVH